jgi:nucleotide-binding universal stress UspA family protein
LDAKLDIIAVVEPLPPLPGHDERHHDEHDESHHPSPLADPTAYVNELAQRPLLAGLEVEAHVAFDPLGPEQGLIDHLADHPATLVATTSRLRIHLDRALHGSTASRIIHASPVPVLVQPATAPIEGSK